jgi:AcrR family transcriptional regulator
MEMNKSDAAGQADAKRLRIHSAAIAEFSERGYTATSMANIASTAQMSRPALYQYFANKGDIFASAFVAVFEEQVTNALAELNPPGSPAEQVDGFLQRYEGDLWQRMAASPHLDEIAGHKTAHVGEAISGEITRLWKGMATYLREAAPGRSATLKAARLGWLEMLQLTPKGFRFDQPTVETYRRRLAALARSVAADIEATRE